MRYPVLLLVVLLAVAPEVRSDEPDHRFARNWPQFRGPTANGIAPDAKPPTSWSESSNIQWRFDIPGVGSSTPIVWENRVFLTSAIKTDRIDESITPPEQQPRNGFFNIKYPNSFYRFLVVCIDRHSGKKIWEATAIEAVPNEGRHPDNTFASSTPATDGKNLYVSFGSQGFYCYSLDGKFKWKRDLGKVKTRNNFGEGASLVVRDGRVVIVRDNETESSITVLNAENGKTVWHRKRNEPSCWATPVFVKRNGIVQVITNGHNRVRSYDLQTGDLIWECGGQVMNVTPSPVLTADHAICMSGYRGNAAVSISLDSRGDVTGSEAVAWTLNDGTPYIPSPVLYKNRLYFTKSNTNILSVVEASTGKVLFNRERLNGIRSMYASPVAADGKIYFLGRGGTTVVLKHGDEFHEIAVNRLEDRFDASPVPVGKQLFLRGRDKLYCISD